jgi:hypothetical protein
MMSFSLPSRCAADTARSSFRNADETELEGTERAGVEASAGNGERGTSIPTLAE